MSELFFSKNTDDRSTILVYDVDWGCHWGVAINTCVIPLLPQSVNRAGGGESEAGQVCESHTTETSPSSNLPSMSSCLSMLATPTSSAMNSLLWVTSSSRSSNPPWLLNLANMFYKHVCAHIYLREMLVQCRFWSGTQYSWTDVSWLRAGETTEALQCPHKLRSMSAHQSVYIIHVHNPDDAHVHTLFPHVAIVG